MLVLSRRAQEKIIIGDGDRRIVITVVRIKKNYSVRLGIEAPKDVKIVREELLSPKNRPASEKQGEQP